MPKLKHMCSLCIALAVVLLATLTTQSSLSQSGEDKSAKLPAGNYSLRVLPYVGPGYDSILS
jgi:hypothetical protein